MVDIVDAATRSRMMAAIGRKDTSPELRVRRYLHRMGLRFRLHDTSLPGSPDLVLPKHRAVVFVHGCFWHRHANCRFSYTPRSRQDFWQHKFETNQARDRRVTKALRLSGWRVFVVWECEVNNERKLERLFLRIVSGTS